MGFVIIVVVITLILVGTALIPRSIKIRQKRAARQAAASPAPDRGSLRTVAAGTDAFLARVVVSKLTAQGVPVTLVESEDSPEVALSYHAADEDAVRSELRRVIPD